MLIHKTYRIVRKLGQGGMGTVYLADHVFMEEQRALKFLSSELSRDADFTSRFRREVRTLRQLRNKNVVDCGDLEPSEDDTLFIAMEYVDGPDLRDFLKLAPRPFDVPMALALTRAIADGLGAAHALGMVHRDIKPANVLMARVGDSWAPKIADFGIVSTKESTTSCTRTGGSLLTMAYAAPEQWRGVRSAELDGRTDLYALGGLLFEILTGRTVFTADSYEGWSNQHLRVAPKPPSSLRPELADWRGLDALVVRLLAKEMKDRPKDVGELVRLLDSIKYVPSTEPLQTPFQRLLSRSAEPMVGRISKGVFGWVFAVSAILVVFGTQAARKTLWPPPPAMGTNDQVQEKPALAPGRPALRKGDPESNVAKPHVPGQKALPTANRSQVGNIGPDNRIPGIPRDPTSLQAPVQKASNQMPNVTPEAIPAQPVYPDPTVSQRVPIHSAFASDSLISLTPFPNYKYGFSPVWVDKKFTGKDVSITRVRAKVRMHALTDRVMFDVWVFLGPQLFHVGHEGQNWGDNPIAISPSRYQVPTQARFVLGTRGVPFPAGETEDFWASYNFETQESAGYRNLDNLKMEGTFTAPMDLPNGLYAQVFVWSAQNRVNIEIEDIQLEVWGVAPPTLSSGR
ncbi:MAG: protein kinase [Terracidiphilus sp.]